VKSALAIALGLALLPALALAAESGNSPASGSSITQRQLRHTEVELRRQRDQTDQLRTRVNDLERRSAANRAQLEQRDNTIAELQRKLDALSTRSGAAPASAGSH